MIDECVGGVRFLEVVENITNPGHPVPPTGLSLRTRLVTVLSPGECEYADVVFVVVMTSPSGTVYMGGQKCPEEMRNSTRL